MKSPPKGKEAATKSYVEAEKIKEPKAPEPKDVSKQKTDVDIKPQEGDK